MALYLDRACPKCGGCFGVVLVGRARKSNTQQVNGLCADCSYQLRWKLVRGGYGKRKGEFWPRVRKRFSDG